MYKQRNATFDPYVPSFAHIIYCTLVKETECSFPRLYVKHLREYNGSSTKDNEQYDNNGKIVYFQVDDDNKVSFKYILLTI